MRLPSPIVLTLLSCIIYSALANVMEQKLSAFNPSMILGLRCAIGAGASAIVLLSLRSDDTAVVWPKGPDVWWVIGACVAFFAADLLGTAAYTEARRHGAQCLFAIVGVSALYPVISSLMKFAITRKAPNGYYMAAYAVAAIVLVLIGLGSRHDRRCAVASAASVAQADSRTP